MNLTGKSVLLFFTAILVATSFLAIQPTNAQWPELTTPEFKVTVRADSFDITIRNQPFPDINTPAYYDIRVKHQGDLNWGEICANYQASGDYTVFSYKINEKGQATTGFGGFVFSDSTVEFQVLRSTYTVSGREAAPPNNYIFSGSNSSWSSTQTYTFPPAPTPIPTPYVQPGSSEIDTSTPPHQATRAPDQQPTSTTNSLAGNVDWIQLVTWTLLSVIIVLLLVVIFYMRKRSVSQ